MKKQTNLPKVSVIVPVYNAEQYLCQCVDSVLAQTYSDWELLLIDDGSTDASWQICNRYARNSAKIKVQTGRNRGVSAARNAGLRLATGEYVMFVDADDFLHESAIEMLVSVVFKYNMDIVMAEYQSFRRLTPTLIYQAHSPIKTKFRLYSFKPEYAVRDMLYQNVLEPTPCAKLFRTSLFADFKFSEGIRYEDLELMPKMVYAAKNVCWIPKEIYFYRKHDESFLHKTTLTRADAITVTAGLSEYFSRRDPVLLKAAHDRELSANFNILTLFERHLNEFSEADREKAERICDEAWSRIKKFRKESLLNRRVRLKNKAAIVASYIGGRRLIRFLSRIIG